MLNFFSLRQLQAKAVFISTCVRLRRVCVFLFLLLCVSFSFSGVFHVSAQETDDEKDPVEIFNQAQDAHEKGDLLKALILYEEALKIAPEFPEAEYQRGNALQSLGRIDEAETAFRNASKLRENWALPKAGLGEILVRKGKYAEAEVILSKAIAMDETNSTAYLALAELQLKTKANLEKVKIFLTKLITLKNPDASIWAARGAVEKYLGDKAAAKESLRKALNLDGKNIYALAEMTDFLIAEKKYDEALKTAQILVKHSPNLSSSKMVLARAYLENGDSASALNTIETIQNPDDAILSFKNEIIAKSTSDIPTLEKQLLTNPKDAFILGRLCSITRTIPAKSLEYCRRASEAEPNNVGHAIGFGAALVQAKQFPSAINLLTKLLQFEPDNYVIHANIATSLFELKRYREAAVEFEWLITKKPELPIAYYFLAISHDNLAEYNEALTNYRKFLQLADAKQNQLEIDKVNLRLPILEKQVKRGEGVKKGRKQ